MEFKYKWIYLFMKHVYKPATILLARCVVGELKTCSLQFTNVAHPVVFPQMYIVPRCSVFNDVSQNMKFTITDVNKAFIQN